MMRKLGLMIILSALLFSLYSFTSKAHYANKVNWMSWEQAMELSKFQKKKIVVAIYTPWCGWCKKMEKTTFSSPQIANYLNDNFYTVRFDAEQKEPVTFNGKVYKYIKPSNGKRGYHEFASALIMGRMSYPTTVFLDENLKIIQPISGYQPIDKFEMIATYFGGDYYKRTPWDKYEKSYIPISKPQLISD